MKLFATFLALLTPFLIAGALSVSAAGPSDTVSLDKDGCSVDVQWNDGRELTDKIVIDVNSVVIKTIDINDTANSDQSGTLTSVTAKEGDTVTATIYFVGDTKPESDSVTITKCPAATPTSTAVPATATPLPTVTSIPPIPTPIVIVQEKVVTVEIPATVKVSPPSTGDGGLR
jgi:hypothetical protein